MAHLLFDDDKSEAESDKTLKALEDNIHFAMQPIVHIQTGATFGFEALLRGHDKAGFNSISEVFDRAWQQGVLHQADMVLREIAIRQFANSNAGRDAHLFYNLDGRIFESRDYHPHLTGGVLNRFGIRPENLVLELSEQYDNASAMHVSDTLGMCRQHDYKLAIDDYGQGFSEMKMLFEHQPDFIKIDRYFITDIDRDSRRRLFVSAIVNLAHSVGTTIIAEGIETEREFLACKAIGCNLAQGYYVAKPTMSPREMEPVYTIVLETNRRDRRRRITDADSIRSRLLKPPTIGVRDSQSALTETFRKNRNSSVFPVLDDNGAPVGILREPDLKRFIYLQEGHTNLDDGAAFRRFQDHVAPCPGAEIDTSIEHLLKVYASAEASLGLIITENFDYIGFLDSDTLLRLANEKLMSQDQESSPLTALPSVNAIVEQISRTLDNAQSPSAIISFDISNLASFNTAHGFRQGDRAIQVVADSLRRYFLPRKAFLGYLGSGSFTAILSGIEDYETLDDDVKNIVTSGTRDCRCLHSAKEQEENKVFAQDFNGEKRDFGLLGLTAAVLRLPLGEQRWPSIDAAFKEMDWLIAEAKKHGGFASMPPIPDEP